MFSFRVIRSLLMRVYFFTDLPGDSLVFDLDAIINLDTTKLQTEATGERIVREIQEWLLTKVSS